MSQTSWCHHLLSFAFLSALASLLPCRMYEVWALLARTLGFYPMWSDWPNHHTVPPLCSGEPYKWTFLSCSYHQGRNRWASEHSVPMSPGNICCIALGRTQNIWHWYSKFIFLTFIVWNKKAEKQYQNIHLSTYELGQLIINDNKFIKYRAHSSYSFEHNMPSLSISYVSPKRESILLPIHNSNKSALTF